MANKPLRQIIIEVLAQMKDVNLDSQAARELVADKIVAQRAARIETILKNWDCKKCKHR
jgi:flagellar basal body-associated protein FliL